MDELIGKLRIDVELINKIKQEAGRVESQVRALEQKINKSFQDMGKQIDDNFTASTEKSQQGFDTLGTKIDEFGRTSSKSATQVDNLKKRMNEVGFQAFLLAFSIQQVSTIVNKFTSQVAKFAHNATSAYAELSSATVDLSNTLGLGEAQTEKMQLALQNLSLVVPVPTEDIFKLANAIADLGVRGEGAVFAVTAQIAQLSVVLKGVPVETLAEQVVSLVRNFQLTISEIDNVGSAIIRLNQEAGGSFESYLTTFNNVSASADRLNISFEETAAVIGTLTKATGDVDQAGKQFQSLIDGISESISEGDLTGYGDQITELFQENAPEAIQVYVKELAKIENAQERSKIAVQDFGTEGARVIESLVTNLDELEATQSAINDEFEYASSFQKEYADQVEQVDSAWNGFHNSVKVLLQTIGADLLPYLTKIIQYLTKGAQILIAVWRSLSPETKKFITIIGAAVVIFGAVLAAFSALAALIAPLVVGFAALVTIAGSVGGALVIVAAVLAIVIGLVVALTAALAALVGYDLSSLNFTDGISKALGLDKIREEIQQTADSYDEGLDRMEDKTNQVTNNIGKALLNVTDLLRSWGQTFLGDYVYEFTRADFELLDSVTDIAEQHFDLLEKAGTLSAEQAVRGLQQVRGYLGLAISEMRDLGEISADTLKRIRDAVGPERAASIIEEIQQGIKVNELEDAVEELGDNLKKLKDNMRREVDLIDQQIAEQEAIFDGQLKPHKENLDDLKKQKKLLERQYRQEVKAYEDRVDVAEEQLDLEKDTLEQIQKVNEAEMDIYEDERETARERLEDAQETLRELKQIRDQEVAAAEGMLDYAKMNLEAAQNQLKKEQILGRDEFDATYRAALERTNAAEDQVDLAYESYIRTKRAYDDEIDVAEDRVETERDILDEIEDTIDNLKKIHKAEEDFYEQRVDIAKEELDLARDSLEDFKDAYNDQKDALQDLIDNEQDAIDDIESLRDEQIGMLKEERDAIEAKYNEEISAIEAKKVAAEDALKAEQDYLYTIQRLNQEYIKTINDRLKAREEDIRDINAKVDVQIPEFENLQDQEIDLGLDIELPDVSGIVSGLKDKIVNFFKNLPTPMELGEQLGEWFRTSIENNPETWKKVLGILVGLIFPPLGIYNLLKDMDWDQTWEDVKTLLKDAVEKVKWEEVPEAIFNIMFPGAAFVLGFIKGALGISSDFEWDKDVKDPLVEKVKGISWMDVITAILESMGLGVPNILTTALGWGGSIITSMATGITNAATSLPGTISNVHNKISTGVNKIVGQAQGWGSKLADRFSSGLDTAKYKVSSFGWTVRDKIIGYGSTLYNAVYSFTSGAYTWGKHMVENMADGIKNTTWKVGSAVSGVADKIKGFLGFTVPDEGPLSGMMVWMPHMMDNIASGIQSGIPMVESEIARVSDLMANGISGEALLNSASIGRLNIAGAAAEFKAPTINQNQDQVIIQAGNVFATEGEMRAFARKLEQYRRTEQQRTGN